MGLHGEAVSLEPTSGVGITYWACGRVVGDGLQLRRDAGSSPALPSICNRCKESNFKDCCFGENECGCDCVLIDEQRPRRRDGYYIRL